MRKTGKKAIKIGDSRKIRIVYVFLPSSQATRDQNNIPENTGLEDTRFELNDMYFLVFNPGNDHKPHFARSDLKKPELFQFQFIFWRFLFETFWKFSYYKAE